MKITTWLARIIGAAKSSDHRPTQQIEYFNAASSATMLFPYGMYANVSNDALCLLHLVGGNSEQRLAIPASFEVRPDLEQGEIAIYRPDGDAVIKFGNDGSIAISTSADVNITAPTSTINGDLVVTGDITANEVTADGVVLTTHTHIGSLTAPTGSQSDTGIPN